MKNAGFCEMRIGLGCLIALLFLADGATAADPTETAVLNSFVKGLSNGDVLGWNGDDACNWKHIVCRGQSVTKIAIESVGLTGTVPADLNKLTNLEYLGFQFNNLFGPLPSLNGLKNLQTAYFNSNNFTTIPSDFFRGLDSLESVYLDYNSLNGTTGWTLPIDVQSCGKLQNLSLTKTGLSGSIPDFLGKMPSLRVLNLAYNRLTGGLPEGFKDSGITQLEVNNMVLEGPIDVVGSMTSLRQLWLQVNKFTGTIPPGLADATGLSDLRLNDNNLKGLIPSQLTTLPSLTLFSVRNNKLMGPIPTMKGTVIVSDGNSFCQSEPGKDCPAELQALLGFLSGVGFPDTLVSSWSGTDPCTLSGAVCQANSVVSLNLPNNQLVGTISPAIGGLTGLKSLTLRNNSLTGPIPSVLGTMKSLEQVDLRNNNLTGPLIKFGGNVKVLLDGNPLLNGSPPSAPAPTLPVVGQPPSAPNAPPTPPTTSPKPPSSPTTPSTPPAKSPVPPTVVGPSRSQDKFPVAAVAIPVAAGVSLALLAGLAIFLFCCRQKGKKVTASRSSSSGMLVHPRNSNSDPDMVKVTVGNGGGGGSGPSNGDVHVVEAGNLVISIQVLRHATKNFSQDTILGRGGFGVVYKGVLDDGTSIAVKRMESSTVVSSKGMSEFHAEIAVLTKVRHRHLVALLGYCIEGNEKLLVYEYLPNGTLGQHLFEHRALGVKPLDWKKRLVIALDVARGMEYLHGLAHMSFIHRDLKPSNILLDDEYRAKVSDFGLVKLAPEGKYSIETRLAGTFGYLAPEYAVTGRVTTKADVFSFGVVLMELITGRKALDETQSEENMHLVTWFRRTNQRRETFPQMIDPTLEATENKVEESIYTVAELAKHCTAREPYNRPDMGHAVSVLAPLVEQWKPSDVDGDETKGIDLNISLPQALKQWQASDDPSSLDDSQASLPTRPVGFADSFTSSDAR